MAPLKFEDHVKEQLDKREIRPSAESWEKLSTRLNEVENRRGMRWWGSAAAAVVVIGIASLIFIDRQNESAAPIVESPTEINEKESEQPAEFREPVQVASEEQNDSQVQEIEQAESAVPETNEIPEDRVRTESEAEQLAQNTSEERIIIEPVSLDPPQPEEETSVKLVGKIDELLARVATQENEVGDVSEAEINKLLAQAASEISAETNYSQRDVNADALLADVEFEVEQSFRQEVFEVLKEGFLKARTAIVTRNE